MANDDTTKALAGRDPLEKLFNDPPTLETNVLDFLLLAGVAVKKYIPPPAYRRSARPDLQARARLGLAPNGRDHNTYSLEHRMMIRVHAEYWIAGSFETLGEMKAYLQEYGIKSFGRDSAIRFNGLLQRHGIEPFCNEGRLQKPERRGWGPYDQVRAEEVRLAGSNGRYFSGRGLNRMW